MKINWTSKRVSNTDWRNYYSQATGYTFLGEFEDGVLIGFITVGEIPAGCERITDINLLRIIDAHRTQINLKPTPFIQEQETLLTNN